jgi:plastocyanin
MEPETGKTGPREKDAVKSERAGEEPLQVDVKKLASGETSSAESEINAVEDKQPADETAPVTPRPQSESSEPEVRGRVEGRITVLNEGRENRFPATHLDRTVVAWRPDRSVDVTPMEEQQIVTRRRNFFPQTMVVTSGTRVRFPNLDPIEHNVFSLTPGHAFDVGAYGPDEGETHVFEGTGTVEIFCDMHPNMAAFMLVLDTPYFAEPDQDGYFALGDLPPGPGELLVWNHRARKRITRKPVADSLRFGDAINVTIDITREMVPQHTDKQGNPLNR